MVGNLRLSLALGLGLLYVGLIQSTPLFSMKRLFLLLLPVLVLVACTSTEELKIGALDHFNRGNGYFAANDFKAAIGEYNQAVALFDEQSAFHYNLGLSYYNLVLYEQAERAYRRAIELDPTFGEAWYNLALVLDKLDRSDEAFMAYDKYQKVNKNKAQVKVKEEPKPKP